LRLTAQASACSRPPEPKINTFMRGLPALAGLLMRVDGAWILKGYLSKAGAGSQTGMNHGISYTGAWRGTLETPDFREKLGRT
jgi:hypothetical protein